MQGAGENTQKIRGIFRDNIKTVLQSQYDFFAIKPKVQDEAETFMHDNFQQILGKVFAPYDVFTNCMALALDNGTDNTDTLDLIDKYFYRKPIPKDQLDINPDTLFTPGEQTTIQATAPTIDLHTKCIITAVVTKGDKQFDKYNIGAATEYMMIKVPKVVNIMSIKYLMPMVGYKLRGYYEVTDIKFDSNTGGVRFKFDKFFPLGDKEVNVAGDMKHGELQNLECIRKLYNKHC